MAVDVQAFAAVLDPGCGWMVVGHMPFMERLVSFLTTDSEDIRVYSRIRALSVWMPNWTRTGNGTGLLNGL